MVRRYKDRRADESSSTAEESVACHESGATPLATALSDLSMDTYTLFFDGSYNNFTGDGSWGAVLFHGLVSATLTLEQQQGEVTRARGFLNQCGSNTVAEADALLHGIKLARQYIRHRSTCKLIVHGDCQTAIRALAWEVLPGGSHLRMKLCKAISLAEPFGSVVATWVPRTLNKVADHEACMARLGL